MLPACNRGPGENICAPDVCEVPPDIPVPFTNHAAHADAEGFAESVFICMKNALTMASTVPTTTGDEPGLHGPGPKRVGIFVAGNPTVFIETIPAVNLTCPAEGNEGNASGMAAVPDVASVFYTDLRGRAQGTSLGRDGLLALQARLRDAHGLEGRMLDDGVACVTLPVFTSDVATRLYNALQSLAGAKGLLLDLRGNPGGDLHAAIRLAADFLPPGSVIARVIDGDGDETEHRAYAERPYELPLMLVVDGHTGSAAELFAGALQHHRRAVVVGEPTFGKGTVQTVTQAARYATVAEVRLPDGAPLEGAGVTPDFRLDLDERVASSS